MKVVISVGSTALLKRGEALQAETLRRNIAQTAAFLATIVRAHQVVLIHGSGPQAGLLALKAEAYAPTQPYPLDVLDAEVGGMIGYLFQQELHNAAPAVRIATLLTQVEVKESDPAFKLPARPMGRAYTTEEAQHFEKTYGWEMVPEGPKWRRVVPSPEPLRILELQSIQTLLEGGTVVVCAGGGGIPVTVSAAGGVRGVEAVIDRDLVAALLAHQVGADALLLLTDVDAVYLGWGGDKARAIRETMPSELRKFTFPPGSMAPKVQAACRFVEAGGTFAGIGKLEDATAILHGLMGTVVRAIGVTLDFIPRSAAPKP